MLISSFPTTVFYNYPGRLKIYVTAFASRLTKLEACRS